MYVSMGSGVRGCGVTSIELRSGRVRMRYEGSLARQVSPIETIGAGVGPTPLLIARTQALTGSRVIGAPTTAG
jgi:hypothetical protein